MALTLKKTLKVGSKQGKSSKTASEQSHEAIVTEIEGTNTLVDANSVEALTVPHETMEEIQESEKISQKSAVNKVNTAPLISKLKIKLISTAKLKAYEHNAKEHPEYQVEQIANSIQEFGFNDPIAVDQDMVIIEGHGRLLAAELLEMDRVPIIVLSHLSDTQKKAYILAHNKLTLNSGFDVDTLNDELMAIALGELDMTMFGFEPEDLDFSTPEFEADSEENQGALDMLEPLMVTCPNCACEFDAKN